MSYQVLARKYRPKDFHSLVGQEHVVRALTHALETKRIHHAYLFTGTRGVGKTTLSRILAKSLNCVGQDGKGDVTAQPCGQCEVCQAIDAGRFVDYIEMDAASNRGVEEMAQLLEQAIYAPSNARFKVYMIDEVHMLTNHAFNAMLKTLEEPPSHVKFILATTDPQKIPVTVLSRCLQFNLKQMAPTYIVKHLENVLTQEKIEFEIPALQLLAKGAQGSMRDALSLTDQAIGYAAGCVSLEAVQGMLGALDQSFLVSILDALANQEGAALLAVAEEMAIRSLSYSAALQDLGTLLHKIAVFQSVPNAVAEETLYYDDIVRLAELFGAEEVQLFYQIVVHGKNELALAPDEYAGFTMTLLRMLAFRPVSKLEGAFVSHKTKNMISSNVSVGKAALENAKASVKLDKKETSINVVHTVKPVLEQEKIVLEKLVEKKEEKILRKEDVAQNTGETVEELLHSIPELNWQGDWPLLVTHLPVRGMVQQLATQSQLCRVEMEGVNWVFHLRIPAETLLSAGTAVKLATALTEYFGKPIRISTEVGAVIHTAHQKEKDQQQQRLDTAKTSIEEDPIVKDIMAEFNATILPGSIKPI